MMTVFGTYGEDYTPGTEEQFLNFLIPLLGPLNPFDGPSSISNELTTPSLNKLPTIQQMQYYNYYAFLAYYMYHNEDFSCELCLKVKPDISHYKGNNINKALVK